jgi:hypothetical protein
MSELTSCNFCKLNRIRRDAKAKGLKVTVLNDARWGMGGSNVYVHPKEIKIEKLSGGENGPRSEFRFSWMMEIPNGCRC